MSRRAATVAAAAAVVVVLVAGQFGVRTLLAAGDWCRVTSASLERERTAAVGLRFYTGNDHPLDPSEGDVYACASGAAPGEEVCAKHVGLFQTRIICRTQ